MAVYRSAFWRGARLFGSAFSDAGPLAEVHEEGAMTSGQRAAGLVAHR